MGFSHIGEQTSGLRKVGSGREEAIPVIEGGADFCNGPLGLTNPWVND